MIDSSRGVSKREKLVEVALRLFARYGFRATGIDRILLESGVAKKTLYRHFRSKNDLIVAALRRYDEQFRNDFFRSLERISEDPTERILGIFDLATKNFSDKAFNGCLFVAAMSEHGEEDSAIRRACQEFKTALFEYVNKLTVQVGAKDPELLARQVLLVYEGAISSAHVLKDPEAARHGKEATKVLLESAVLGD